MKHLVELNFLVTDGDTGKLLDPEDFEKHVDEFTEHLVSVSDRAVDIADVTVDAVLAEGIVRVELWVESAEEVEAVEEGYSFVIPAILAVGGSLPGLVHPALLQRELWQNLPTAAQCLI